MFISKGKMTRRQLLLHKKNQERAAQDKRKRERAIRARANREVEELTGGNGVDLTYTSDLTLTFTDNSFSSILNDRPHRLSTVTSYNNLTVSDLTAALSAVYEHATISYTGTQYAVTSVSLKQSMNRTSNKRRW